LLLARLFAAAGPTGGVVALHVLAALSLIAVASALIVLVPARRRPVALALGVANPLVLLQLLAAAHWEALMGAAVMAALAFWRRGHPILAVLLASVAATVKPPAALAVLVLGGAYVLSASSWPIRVRRSTSVAAAAAAPWLAALLAVPNAFGFVPALVTPLAGRTPYAPTTAAAELIAAVGHLLGVGTNFGLLLSVTRMTGMLVSGVIVLYLLATARRRTAPETIGAALLAVALLGPVLYPWYLTWGLLPLIAAAGRERFLIALSAVSVFTGLPDCQPLVSALVAPHTRAGTALAITAATAMAAMAGISGMFARERREGKSLL